MATVANARIEHQTNSDPAVVDVCYRHPTFLVEDYEQFSNKLFEIFHKLIFYFQAFIR